MTEATTPSVPRKVALFSADKWEHVCPVVRVRGPCELAGLEVLQGSEWAEGQIRVVPTRVSEADVVVVQRNFPYWTEKYDAVVALAHAQNKAVVYDLDDLLIELPASHPDVCFYDTTRAAIMHALAEADVVTCSTSTLADYLKPFNPNVQVLPNYLDDRLWAKGLQRSRETDIASNSGKPVTIGYMGGHSHLADLEVITQALLELSARFGEAIRLRFWGGRPPLDLLGRDWVEWSEPALVDYAEFAEYFGVQECDIFVAPLQDNFFNRCKSPLKFLEYGALGVPGVFSRIAPFEQVIDHGDNGFLASTQEEWIGHLSQLIEDPDLRHRVGLKARQSVHNKWLLSQHAHDWAAAYGKALSAARGYTPLRQAVPFTRQFRAWYDELERRAEAAERHARAAERHAELAEQYARMADERSQESTQKLIAQEQTAQMLRSQIEAILNSPGWKFVEMIGATRRRIIPRDSRREQLALVGVNGLRVWKQEGLRALFRRVAQGSPLRISGPVRGIEGAQVVASFSIAAGSECQLPAISVLLIREAGRTQPEEQLVADWVAAQSYPAAEVVVWDKQTGNAHLVSRPAIGWEARDVQQLVAGLPGLYVCVASESLLECQATYLEENLVALETESLALTVNADGNADEVAYKITQERLPGDFETPLRQQVVRKDCLRSDLSLDLSAWVESRFGPAGGVVGKILSHTRDSKRSTEGLRFYAPVQGVRVRVLDSYILALAPGQPFPPKAIEHEVHPPRAVLPPCEIPTEKPVVIVVMPFLAVGGAERVALDVMRYLQHDIRFVVVAADRHDPALGSTVDAFRQITPYVYTCSHLPSLLNISFMEYLIQRFRPRTLYIANGSGWVYDALGTLKQQYPELRTVNQVYDHRAGWINRYDSELVANLDAHIGPNQHICEEYGRRGARVETIYQIEHPVDTDEFDPSRYSAGQRRAIRERLGLAEARQIVTFIARLHPQKRPMDFVELARHFVTHPSVAFLMVGDGPLANVLDMEILRTGLRNLVRRPFYRPSRDIFAASDVIVLPSEYEGMPLVILEAQSMGKPVVVTDVGNTREILKITRGGVVVPRIGDIAALEAGVRQMLQEPPDPDQVRQAIVAHSSLHEIGEQYRRVLLGA